MITLEPTETRMVGKAEAEEVARCQVVSTADINTREEACPPATKLFISFGLLQLGFIEKQAMPILYLPH